MDVLDRLPAQLAAEIIQSQLASGAFPSVMIENGKPAPDENAFVTAQILRVLGRHTTDPALRSVTPRALDFLEMCEDPARPGAYRFWTDANRPRHLPIYPADADDTSVIAMELARHGRRNIESLRRTVLLALLPHRVRIDKPLPASWVVPGAFWTWLDPDFGYNVVDCTVNANVAALMASTGLTHIPGYEQACAMIESAVTAAAGDEHLTRLLSPYYPHPRELLFAVTHAISFGAERLRCCVHLLHQWGEILPNTELPVFCSAYGRVEWRAPLLQRIRLFCKSNNL